MGIPSNNTIHSFRKIALRSIRIGLAIIVSLILSATLIRSIGHNPFEVYQQIWEGSFQTMSRLAGVLNYWIPLTLVSTGLVVTFRTGLWNIGIEGQIMFGAIFASGVALFLPAPAIIRVPAAIIAAGIGGIFWAHLAGILKTRLGVHEIFSGIALNAIAYSITNYLITDLWSPPWGGNAQDTGPFERTALLPTFSSDFPTNVPTIIVTLIIVVITVIVLHRTHWGLKLKAVGKSARSALLLNVPVERTYLSALVFCGALAGLAGAYRVLFTYGTLRAHASGGIGFLGILVVLLINNKALWVLFVTFVFATLSFGSTYLRVSLGLDISLAKTLQELLVLLVILSDGLRLRISRRFSNPNYKRQTIYDNSRNRFK